MVFQKREGYLNSCFLQVPNLDLIPEYQTTKSAFTRVTCSGVTLLARETSTWSRIRFPTVSNFEGYSNFFKDTKKHSKFLLNKFCEFYKLILTGLWQMFNTPIVRFVPILFNSSHCSPYG